MLKPFKSAIGNLIDKTKNPEKDFEAIVKKQLSVIEGNKEALKDVKR